jgi:hypothetical protein
MQTILLSHKLFIDFPFEYFVKFRKIVIRMIKETFMIYMTKELIYYLIAVAIGQQRYDFHNKLLKKISLLGIKNV